MSILPPLPVTRLDDFSNEDEYFEYLEKQNDYIFKTRWLQVALTPTEFAATVPVAIPLLIDMYPDIRQEGAMGGVWYTQLRQLRRIFDGKVNEIDPFKCLEAFNALYHSVTYTYSHDDAIWQHLKAAAEADWSYNAVYPDFDSYNAGPPWDILDSNLLRKLNRTDDPQVATFHTAADDHARLVLLSYIMRPMQNPVLDDLLARHDAFVAQYRLLP